MPEDRPGIIPEYNGPLPVARRALEQVRRQLTLLSEMEDAEQKYRDFLPWVLDRLENVWRMIDAESKGRRTHDFGAWWASQKTGNRQAVNVLRNAELKRNERTTMVRRVYNSGFQVRVSQDGSVSIVSPDGTELPRDQEGNLPAINIDISESVKPEIVEWSFNVPGLEGRSVQEVLETVYRGLETEVLPTAETKLGAPSSGS